MRIMDVTRLPLASLIAVVISTTSANAQETRTGLLASDAFSLKAYVSGLSSYDSNARFTENDEQDDIFFEGELGLSGAYEASATKLSGAAFVYSRAYSDSALDDLDQTSMGGRLRGTYSGNEKLAFSALAAYQRSDDYSRSPGSISIDSPIDSSGQKQFVVEDSSERQERDLLDFGIGTDVKLTDKIPMQVEATYHEVNFDSDALFDSIKEEVGIRLGYDVTPKSTTFAYGSTGTEKSDAFDDDTEFYRTGLGWETEVSAKTAVTLTAGLIHHDDKTTAASGGGFDSEQDEFNFSVAARWQPKTKLVLEAFAGNDIKPTTSERNNTRNVTSGSMVASYRASPDIVCMAAASVRNDNFRRPSPDTGITRDVDTVGGRAGLLYRPINKFYSVNLELSHEESDSNAPGESASQTRVTASVRLDY